RRNRPRARSAFPIVVRRGVRARLQRNPSETGGGCSPEEAAVSSMAVQAPTRTAFTWRSSSATSTGNVRSHNEDALLDRPDVGLWVVADGMGGHNAGDVASNMIVQSLSGLTRRASPSAQLDEVEDRLREVNRELYQASLDSQAGMSGSTIVALLALERYCLSIWAGDSRVYRSRDGSVEQVTRDHSEAQEMRDGGMGDSPEALTSNVITRAVGGSEE